LVKPTAAHNELLCASRSQRLDGHWPGWKKPGDDG